MAPIRRFDGFVFGSLILGLMLTILPLPDFISAWRPAWLAMLVVYWTIHQPERFGLLGAWLIGIAMDTLTGTLLGQHALALMVIAFISLKLHLRIRVFPKGQQALTVLMLILVYEFLLFWVDGVAGFTTSGMQRWMPVLSSTALWLPMCAVLKWALVVARRA
ncbi:MAG: rod shape-determining protein MreD [Gammaproteobacteria bacterium]|nr:rod shape-determining protein MreD [Gammaproteobacteria bacterium]